MDKNPFTTGPARGTSSARGILLGAVLSLPLWTGIVWLARRLWP